MTAVRKLREAIDETADRWESAAASLETCVASSRAAFTGRIESLRRNALFMAERLGIVLEEARELSPEARARVVRQIDQFREYLSESGFGNYETALARRQGIEVARRKLEERLECIAEDVHPDFEQALRNWVRAQMELETGLELMGQPFVYKQTMDSERYEAHRREMLKSIEQFRNMLNEKRFSAPRRGRPFGSEMNAAWLRICRFFQRLSA